MKILLHEMSWTEAKEYFTKNDIAILPVGSNERYSTENDVDIAILTPNQKTHSFIKSIVFKKVGGFKKLNWSEEESVNLDP